MTLTAAIALGRLTAAPGVGRWIGRAAAATDLSPRRSWMSSVVSLSDEDAVTKFRKIHPKSILYFTATWCPPCKAIGPVYEKMSIDHPNIAFGKVDVDNNQEAAAEFKVSSVPTFVTFDGEEAVEKFLGADRDKLTRHVLELEGR